MSQDLYTLSLDSIKYILGLIRDTVDLPTTILDDLNITTNTTYSSYRLDTLLKALKDENIKYCDEAIAGLNKLTKEIVDDSSKVVKENTIYLILTNPVNNVYEQWLLINGTPQMIGTTEMNLDSVYTKDEADARYTLITDFNSLKTKVDGKVDKTDIIDNLTSTDTNKPLSANQGKVLKDEINLKANDSDVVKKTDISTTIDSTSTDDTIPTNKTVYDSIKNKNTIQPTGTIANYSTVFDWAMNNVGATCGYEGNMFDDCPLPNTWGTLVCIGTKVESGLKVLFCTNFNKDIYVRTIQRRNGVNAWVTSWQRVCTTSVEDVPRTDIIFTDTTSYSIANNADCRYFVENGICTMILHVRCNTPYGWVTVADNIPKSRGFHCYQMLSSLDGTSFMRCTIRTSGKIELSRGVADTEYIGTFSYPVAE